MDGEGTHRRNTDREIERDARRDGDENDVVRNQAVQLLTLRLRYEVSSLHARSGHTLCRGRILVRSARPSGQMLYPADPILS